MEKKDLHSNKVKGFLSVAFKKVANATGSIIAAYSFPLGKNCSSFKSIAIFLGTSLIAQPLTSSFFPSAEDFLEQQGVPTSIATDLTEGNRTYIRGSDTMGTIHRLMDVPNIFYATYSYIATQDTIESSFSRPPLHSALNCRISALGNVNDNKNTKKILDRITRLPESFIKNTGISYKEFYYFVLFHEIRHCSDANKDLPSPYQEADADYHAIKATEKIFKNTQIAKFVLNFRALIDSDFDPDHDTSLYLNAKLHGIEPPNIEDTITANKSAEDILHSNILIIRPLKKVKHISTLARKRIELHVNALKIFTKKPRTQIKAQMRRI